MPRNFEQAFFQREHTDIHQAYEKMLNITNLQENANQNHSEMSPHTYQSMCVCVHTQLLSRVQYFATPWTVACQDPLSIRLSRQEHWSGQQLSSPGDLPDQGIEPRCPALQADSLLSEPLGKPLLEWLLVKRQGLRSVDKDVEKRERLCIIGGNVNQSVH